MYLFTERKKKEKNLETDCKVLEYPRKMRNKMNESKNAIKSESFSLQVLWGSLGDQIPLPPGRGAGQTLVYLLLSALLLL